MRAHRKLLFAICALTALSCSSTDTSSPLIIYEDDADQMIKLNCSWRPNDSGLKCLITNLTDQEYPRNYFSIKSFNSNNVRTFGNTIGEEIGDKETIQTIDPIFAHDGVTKIVIGID